MFHGYAVPSPQKAIHGEPLGFAETGCFTGQMLFLPPSGQCHSAELSTQ